MSKIKLIEFNVNQVSEAIEKYSGYRNILIDEVQIANLNNQWYPERKRVGMGGVLTLFCSCIGRKK